VSDLKRWPVKYIRDGAKSAYKKDIECYVCGINKNLELHHTHSISQLFKNYCNTAGIRIEKLEDILQHRDQFIDQHRKEIYEDVYTLCKICHLRLHKLFGQRPALVTASKQSTWLDKLKEKV